MSAIADAGIVPVPEVAAGAPADVPAAAQRLRTLAHAHRPADRRARSWRIAVFGPYLAPHSPTRSSASPNTQPSNLLFGTDHIGQDVWSRFLSGGGQILAVSALATILGLVLGVIVGLVAAYSRNWLDDVLMRAMDVILAFPQIMLALVADHDTGRDVVADRAGGRPDHHAARRARHPRRGAARGRARFRGRRRGARRSRAGASSSARSCPTSSRR